MTSLACAEVNNYLESYYPELEVKEFITGQYGLYQREIRMERYDVSHMFGYGPDYSDNILVFPEVGYRCLFSVRNRVFGWWIVDEVKRRDPKLASNPGNYFHEDFLRTRAAEENKTKERTFARSSAIAQWDIVRKNRSAMDAVGSALARGDSEGAARELSLEGMKRRAHVESPRELLDNNYWKNL